MGRVVHKQLFRAIDGPQHFRNCKNPKMLKAGLDPRGSLAFWYETDQDTTPGNVITIYVIGTGVDEIPSNTTYLGTITSRLNVWHIYYSIGA